VVTKSIRNRLFYNHLTYEQLIIKVYVSFVYKPFIICRSR